MNPPDGSTRPQSKSEQIRLLAQQGMSTKDIAAKLGIRYQHVYGVLKGARGLAPIPAGLSRSAPARSARTSSREPKENEASVFDSFWDAENNVHRVVVRMYRLVPNQSPFRPNIARYVGPYDPVAIERWVQRCTTHGYISASDYDEQISLIRAVLRKNEKMLSAPVTNDWDTPTTPPTPPKPPPSHPTA